MSRVYHVLNVDSYELTIIRPLQSCGHGAPRPRTSFVPIRRFVMQLEAVLRIVVGLVVARLSIVQDITVTAHEFIIMAIQPCNLAVEVLVRKKI